MRYLQKFMGEDAVTEEIPELMHEKFSPLKQLLPVMELQYRAKMRESA